MMELNIFSEILYLLAKMSRSEVQMVSKKLDQMRHPSRTE